MAYSPKDIEIEEMDNGWYMVFYIDNDGDRKSLHVPSPEEFNDPISWVRTLDDSELEASIQIFYDRWNFEEGDNQDKTLLDDLYKERELRKTNPYHKLVYDVITKPIQLGVTWRKVSIGPKYK